MEGSCGIDCEAMSKHKRDLYFRFVAFYFEECLVDCCGSKLEQRKERVLSNSSVQTGLVDRRPEIGASVGLWSIVSRKPVSPVEVIEVKEKSDSRRSSDNRDAGLSWDVFKMKRDLQ